MPSETSLFYSTVNRLCVGRSFRELYHFEELLSNLYKIKNFKQLTTFRMPPIWDGDWALYFGKKSYWKPLSHSKQRFRLPYTENYSTRRNFDYSQILPAYSVPSPYRYSYYLAPVKLLAVCAHIKLNNQKLLSACFVGTWKAPGMLAEWPFAFVTSSRANNRYVVEHIDSKKQMLRLQCGRWAAGLGTSYVFL